MPSGAFPTATKVSAERTCRVITNFGAAACHAPSFSSASLAVANRSQRTTAAPQAIITGSAKESPGAANTGGLCLNGGEECRPDQFQKRPLLTTCEDSNGLRRSWAKGGHVPCVDPPGLGPWE